MVEVDWGPRAARYLQSGDTQEWELHVNVKAVIVLQIRVHAECEFYNIYAEHTAKGIATNPSSPIFTSAVSTVLSK